MYYALSLGGNIVDIYNFCTKFLIKNLTKNIRLLITYSLKPIKGILAETSLNLTVCVFDNTNGYNVLMLFITSSVFFWTCFIFYTL